MNKEEIRNKIKEIIADKNGIKISDVKDESNVQADLGLDSLDRFELFIELEKEFNVTITDEEAETVFTVNEFAELVEQKLELV